MSEALNWPDDSGSSNCPPEGELSKDQGKAVEYHIKEVVLSSGKKIEIVYFSRSETEHPPLPVAVSPKEVPVEPEAPAELHICPECRTDNVYPIAWEESIKNNEYRWQLDLRCPNC